MDDTEFDRALIGAAFGQIAARGWLHFSVAAAAREAGLPLDRARLRIPGRCVLLLRFGRMADAAALAGTAGEGSVRDHLFDMMMRRIDVLQSHRAGVIALLRAVPCDPAAALLLARASLGSMGWLLEAAGISATGPLGHLRRRGLLAAWLWTVRAWQRDESADLAATMAALDHALRRAERLAEFLHRPRGASPPHGPPGESAPQPSPEPAPETSPEPPEEPPPLADEPD